VKVGHVTPHLARENWTNLSVVFIDIRTKKSYIAFVNTNQFLRKVRRAGRNNGVAVSFNPKRGKGSHGTLPLWRPPDCRAAL
jgi:hypothetical protein